MDEARECQQCGKEFTPRREHARFCSARCRMAWNLEHASVPGPPHAALGWSVTAMADAVGRLGRARAWDLPRTVAAVSEATWNPLPEPEPRPLSARGQEWEMTRYDAYQSRLAGRDIAETFALTAGFLNSAAEVIPPSVLLERNLPS